MAEDLRISEAAVIIGVHENTIRNAIKRYERSEGKEGLRAALKPGPWGKQQYHIHPKVFAAWVLERYGRQLSDEELAPGGDGDGTAEVAVPVSELYERLILAESTAARFLALEAATEDIKGIYAEQLRRKDEELAAVRAALEAERRRGWVDRLLHPRGT